MALIKTGLEAAQAAVAKAEKTVTDWEAKAESARSEAAKLDADSGALILEDESQADTLTLKIHSWERKARAYDQAAAEARNRLIDARRRALEAEAEGYEKAAAAAKNASQRHQAKIDALLATLLELDNVPYVANNGLNERLHVGTTVISNSVSAQHRGTVAVADTKARVIRHYLAHGTLPLWRYELGYLHSDGAGGEQIDPAHIPDSVRALSAGGIQLSGPIAA